MYIRIAANGEVPLLDVDNMRRYSVVAEIAADSVKQLAEITTRTQDNHCRADAEAVVSRLTRCRILVFWMVSIIPMVTAATEFRLGAI